MASFGVNWLKLLVASVAVNLLLMDCREFLKPSLFPPLPPPPLATHEHSTRHSAIRIILVIKRSGRRAEQTAINAHIMKQHWSAE